MARQAFDEARISTELLAPLHALLSVPHRRSTKLCICILLWVKWHFSPLSKREDSSPSQTMDGVIWKASNHLQSEIALCKTPGTKRRLGAAARCVVSPTLNLYGRRQPDHLIYLSLIFYLSTHPPCGPGSTLVLRTRLPGTNFALCVVLPADQAPLELTASFTPSRPRRQARLPL